MPAPQKRYISFLVHLYLEEYGIYRSLDEVCLIQESHPNINSLWAISQTLAYFGVENHAFTVDYAGLQETKGKAILFLNSEEKFVLLRKVTRESIAYHDVIYEKDIQKTRVEFLKEWEGVVLVAKRPLKTINTREKKSYQTPIFSILLLFLLSINFYFSINYNDFALLLLNIVGLVLSVATVFHNTENSYNILDRVCYSSKHFACKEVTGKALPNILKKISLTDFSIVFFLSGTLLFISFPFLRIRNEVYLCLQWATTLSIPVIFFSIWYQKFKVKKWCVFCLLIASTLTIQIILYFAHWQNFLIKDNISRMIYIFILTTLFAYLALLGIKKYLRQKQEIKNEQINHLRLKREPSVIAKLFRSQPFTQLSEELFSFGQIGAPICVTTVLSLNCKYCSEVVYSMVEILDKYPNVVRWKLFFNGIVSDTFERANETQLLFLSVIGENQKNIVKDWYKYSSVKYLTNQYLFRNIDKTTIARLKRNTEEIKNNSIDKVPYVLINDIKLPKEYSIYELPLLFLDQELFINILSSCQQPNKHYA